MTGLFSERRHEWGGNVSSLHVHYHWADNNYSSDLFVAGCEYGWDTESGLFQSDYNQYSSTQGSLR